MSVGRFSAAPRPVAWICLSATLAFVAAATTGAFDLPEQVHLSSGRDPSRMRVTWVTQTPEPLSDSMVEYGFSASALTRTASPFAASAYENPGIAKRRISIYVADMVDLPPFANIFYRVGSPASGTWSQVFLMKTLTDEIDIDTTYLYFADFGFENARAMPLITELVPTVDLVVQGGDQGYNLEDWEGKIGDEYGRMIEPAAAIRAWQSVAGNHERAFNYSQYVHRYHIMDEVVTPFYWSFDHGLVHWVGIHTEPFLVPEERAFIRPMLDWLQADLARANANRQQRPWLFVVGHHPLYCALPCASLEADIVRKQLEQILFDAGVDLYLTGHIHTALLSYPTFDRRRTNDDFVDPKAPVYLMSGAAGCDEVVTPVIDEGVDWAFKGAGRYSVSRLHVANATHVHLEQIAAEDSSDIFIDQWLVQSRHGPFHR